MTADREVEVRALLVLDQIPGVGLKTLAALVARFGSGRAALAAPDRAFSVVAGQRAALARSDAEMRDRVAAGLNDAARLNAPAVTWSDAEYPSILLNLADPPPVLFLRGRAELLSTPCITSVGARKATARARDFARRLASALARSGYTIVSGMALGIDGCAHLGVLDAGGGTIAVLGRGSDRAYPASHERVFRDILAVGLVVSEFLPGRPALPHHFPRRNRVPAALGQAVVVVEASRRSGSLITVEHALDLGVDVYAVPGPVEQPACEGSNALLVDGARPLVSVERVPRRTWCRLVRRKRAAPTGRCRGSPSGQPRSRPRTCGGAGRPGGVGGVRGFGPARRTRGERMGRATARAAV